jgi:hypothetical protein
MQQSKEHFSEYYNYIEISRCKNTLTSTIKSFSFFKLFALICINGLIISEMCYIRFPLNLMIS